jgi:hypothetical protein
MWQYKGAYQEAWLTEGESEARGLAGVDPNELRRSQSRLRRRRRDAVKK